MTRGVTTVLEGGNLHLLKGEVVVPLQQRKEDLGLISFEVEITAADSGASSSGIAKALTPGATEASSPGVAGAASPGIDVASSPEIPGSSAPGAGVTGESSATAGASSPGAEGSSSGAGTTSPGVKPVIAPGATRCVSPWAAPPTLTGVAPDAQYHVAASTVCGPTAEGSFTEDTFEVAYDELTPSPLLNLAERAPRVNPSPRVNPLDRAKPPDKCGSFADTDRDPFRGSKEENMVIQHQDPLHGTTSPGTLGAQAREVIGASAVGITGLPPHFGASAPGTTGSPSPELTGVTASEIAGSSTSWIFGAPAGGTASASYGVAGSSPSRTTGASSASSSSAVDGSTTSASPGVADDSLELRARPKLNTETDSEKNEIHTLTQTEEQPRASPAAGPLDFAHGDGEPVLTSTAFVYTRKPTSSFLFFLDGGSIRIGAKT